MWDFLDKLREKSDAQKLVICFVFALVLTFVIVVTWLTVVFSTSDEKEVKQETEIKRADEVTPLSNIGEQVGEIRTIFGELMSQFDSEEGDIYELPEVEGGTTTITNLSTTTAGTNDLNSTTTLEIESSIE
ncbi:MAG: hypothetical protein WC087_00485 [Candidatus Paceibacterota bacterium]